MDLGWNNAAVRLLILERFDEAVALMEEFLIQRESLDVNASQTFSNILVTRGNYERAYRLLQETLAVNPGSALAHNTMGDVFVHWGKLEEAVEAYDKAENLLAGPAVQHSRWWVFVLRDEWEEAAAVVKKLTVSPDYRWRWQGWMNDALLWLHRGQAERALASLDRARAAPAEAGRISGLSHALASHVMLENNQLTRSLEHALKAQKEGSGNIAEWEGLFFEGLAHTTLGRLDLANEAAEKLRERTHSIPSEKEKRRHRHLIGEIARVRGDLTSAINELEKAQRMLPPYGNRGYLGQNRCGAQPAVPLWYSLASAYLDTGDDNNAARWFERIAESTFEHVEWPIPYVRSFYFLGKIHENRGDMEKGRECYRRFYEYWKDGDMDRDRIEEVKTKI